jgi:hypothetical protein
MLSSSPAPRRSSAAPAPPRAPPRSASPCPGTSPHSSAFPATAITCLPYRRPIKCVASFLLSNLSSFSANAPTTAAASPSRSALPVTSSRTTACVSACIAPSPLPSTLTRACCVSRDTPCLSVLLSSSSGIPSGSISAIFTAACPAASPCPNPTSRTFESDSLTTP